MGSLLLAVVVWWLIKSELDPERRTVNDLSLPEQTLIDL